MGCPPSSHRWFLSEHEFSLLLAAKWHTSVTFAKERLVNQKIGTYTCPCGIKFRRYKSAIKTVQTPCCSRKCASLLGRFPRNCVLCGERYQPQSSRQRWCYICAPNEKARRRIQRYGISVRDWERLFLQQNGLCAICQERPATVVDHCHVTKRVRGLLCHGCNHRLVSLDREGWLDKARAYVHH
jgi:hypothetical protein